VSSSSPESGPRIVIVGGGISGLSTAYFLEQRAARQGLECSIELLEARARFGGVLQTERCGEFLIEGGPDSFLTQKPAAIELCRELGLGDQLIPSQDEKRKTFVLHQGKLKPLPDGLLFVIPTRIWPVLSSELLSLGGKLRLALAPFLPPLGNKKGDESVADFISQRFGRQVLERLAEPLLAAVYGSDITALSARAALPQLIAVEEKYGSLWRGLPHMRPRRGGPRQPIFTTLSGGVGELPAALQKHLQRTQMVQDRSVHAIRPQTSGGGYRVEWQGGETVADAVIVATPAHAAAAMLQAFDPLLSELLSGISYNSSVMVALAYPKDAFARNSEGFGFVVPRTEGRQVIACTWSSTKFPYRSSADTMLLRCFLGGARNPSVINESDEWIVTTALAELDALFQARREPLFTKVYRWERCMPQYAVGHEDRLRQIDSRLALHPGLFLAGNAYRGVGIPDCIQSGSKAAGTAVELLQNRYQRWNGSGSTASSAN
jgi:oxygen-dependent protoporphyrinogen oxidase